MILSARHMLVLVVLAGASAALGWRIQADLRAPDPAVDALAGGAGAAAPGDILDIPTYAAPPAETFVAVLERPLFDPERRPPSIEETPEAPAPQPQEQPLRATLRGVVMTDGEAAALVTPDGSSQVLRVAEGELFLGWRLLEIHPDQVVFGKDDLTVTLDLRYK